MLVSFFKKLTVWIAVAIAFIAAIILLSFFVLTKILSGYSVTVTDPVIQSLPSYKDCVKYTEGEFQDYTDYYIYHYEDIALSELESNQYLNPVGEHMSSILPYIEDYEKWIEMYRENDALYRPFQEPRELPAYYDFDKSIIDESDFFYIENENENSAEAWIKYSNYDLYFFDVQSNTLYYFHNNI